MSLSAVRNEVYERVSRSQFYRDNLAGLTAHQRHQRLLAQLPGRLQAGSAAAAEAAAGSNTVTDEDVLRQHHRFLRGPGDDAQSAPDSWGARLARRYYDRLFKEFAICDLSRYKEAKVGLRWRTKSEVVSGKGQFVCGAKGCSAADGLASYEVNFAYVEAGVAKAALVKLRLCEDCAHKLNYKKERQYRRLGASLLEQQDQDHHQQQQRISDKHRRRHKRRAGSPSSDSDSEGGGRGRASTGVGAGGSNKRVRPGSGALEQREGRRGTHAAAAAGAAAGRAAATADAVAADAALGDADIDAWLDNMFTAADQV